ncbi:MAG: hypothetical protein R3264_16100, partial [Anaerolineae bacterium]|nr:hypothetical protein [Anaerolineae bacterium]
VLRHTFEQEVQTVDLPVLVTSVRQALAEKHLQIYLNDPITADLLAEAGLDGALQTNEGDFLMVVDANLGFNKASALVERKVAHTVRLALDGSAEVDTRLTYTHTAPAQTRPCSQTSRYDPVYEQNMVRCYWNYGQLLVPTTAKLVQGPHQVVEGQYLLRAEPTSGQIDEAVQPGHKMSWGQLFLLPPAEQVTLDYRYSLPAGTAQLNSDTWSYNLYLQKQPGTLTTEVEVMIFLPPGTQLEHSYPAPTTEQDGKLTFDFSLQTDKHLSVTYHHKD